LEILHRINARSHEFAQAVMHTTGQAYGMAFQAGGPHAQDRGLEAVAYAYAEQTRLPEQAGWTKPQGKREPLVMTKEFTVVPRGLALLIGCNTFPTWNGYPGLFASLATGNPVLVKPHPRAVLPLALTVAVAREVLSEAGFDPNLVCLAAEHEGGTVAQTLAVRPEIKMIDYTGSTAFGDWLEENARQAQVYTEKAGVNAVVIDSTDDYKGMLGNLAFALLGLLALLSAVRGLALRLVLLVDRAASDRRARCAAGLGLRRVAVRGGVVMGFFQGVLLMGFLHGWPGSGLWVAVEFRVISSTVPLGLWRVAL
ncbi:aldehyde dehydrogenase family protein, partial [Streptomyces sp. NPDC048209]|uniref:aldehyde dehydrogenase family protein n=1 Tax=Streptomyces sp. NPDC048209 TaxID=3156689 RepID=UPI003426A499